MRIHATALAIVLTAACGGPQQRSLAESTAQVEPAPAPGENGREIRLVEVASDLVLEESSIDVGEDVIVLLDGGADAMTYYAGVRVNDGPAHWLDLHTDEERASGASPESGWGWVQVKVAPDAKTVVGVLDWFVGSSGPTLFIVTSVDGGRTWALRAEVEKSHHMALFHALELDADGWELTIRLDDCGGCETLAGDTVWTSAPGGDDWVMMSGPTAPDRPVP